MASIKKAVFISEEDYATLLNQGSITKTIDQQQVTEVYDVNNMYFTDYLSSELIDDSNSTKKFMTPTEKAQLNDLPNVFSALNGKQDTLEDTGANKNFAKVNGQSLLAGQDFNISGIEVLTTAPTSANTSGVMKFVYLTSTPSNKYAGYIYLIAQS